ncbi:tetratricopeptide repeat protein [Testudinibacter sp. P27/CKL/0425]
MKLLQTAVILSCGLSLLLPLNTVAASAVAASEKPSMEQTQAESDYQQGLNAWYGLNHSKIDDQAALRYFEQAAAQGNADALASLANYYTLEQYADYPKAFKLAAEAAEKGAFYGELVLAALYDDGLGVAQDKPKAQQLYRKLFPQVKSAVEQGKAEFATRLAYLYEQGLGTAQNAKQAFSLYKQAADQGNATAAESVADYYANGYDTVEIDFEKAMAYYLQAAEANHAEAQYQSALLYQDADNLERAIFWFEQAAKQQHSEAILELGMIYYLTDDLQDYAKARAYFEQAEKLGNAGAVYSVGLLYENGFGVEGNTALALEKFKTAAEMGDAEAQVRLGDYYVEGTGTQPDNQQAEFWYQKAADQGLTSGYYKLAELYQSYATKPYLEQALAIYQYLNDEYQLDEQQSIEQLEAELREMK